MGLCMCFEAMLMIACLSLIIACLPMGLCLPLGVEQ